MTPATDTPAFAVILGEEDGRLWGMTTTERHRRLCTRLGIGRVVSSDGGPAPQLLLRRDFAFDASLLRALSSRPGTVLMAPDATGTDRPVAAHVMGEAASLVSAMIHAGRLDPARLPAGIAVEHPETLGPGFDRVLRKRAKPFALHVTPATRRAVEWRSFREAYKGATDFVTKYLWPLPAFHVTRWCAERRLTPNMVTSVGFVLMLLATVLFWQGHLLLGLLPAWIMTFLDTVDGKLARCTFQSSRWGDVFDHGVDLLHPPFWWLAWWHGLSLVEPAAPQGPLWAALLVILVGYVLLRLEEGTFKLLFGIQTHIWRPIDYHFRSITARRNPNLAILTVATLTGAPAEGFLVVAVWTVVSVLFHALRLLQAGLARRTGPIVSWLDAAA
ncbi:CDP-alcohol phosphatidyltransferase family protein [Benzoatithermus flavus]|uniref:CDP-alcohol phosphatidyltransferase family protein n=1 Tax=Benzoatithermus flavus TaxID=3108223 RepID=A0ABU8XWU2_9PROT